MVDASGKAWSSSNARLGRECSWRGGECRERGGGGGDEGAR